MLLFALGSSLTVTYSQVLTAEFQMYPIALAALGTDAYCNLMSEVTAHKSNSQGPSSYTIWSTMKHILPEWGMASLPGTAPTKILFLTETLTCKFIQWEYFLLWRRVVFNTAQDGCALPQLHWEEGEARVDMIAGPFPVPFSTHLFLKTTICPARGNSDWQVIWMPIIEWK